MIETLTTLVSDAIRQALAAGELKLAEVPVPFFERPRDETHGDWATNVALQSAKAAGMPSRAVAELIARYMGGHPDIDAIEIAGPGFINIRLSQHALQRTLREVRERGSRYGSIDLGAGRKVQIEFVSANPVGPMHVGHGRWAALGDGIARVLEHAGWVVEREFYINDAGVQMDIFGKSVAARYLELCGREVTFADDWYQGAYITEIAREIFEREGDAWADAEAEARESHFRPGAGSPQASALGNRRRFRRLVLRARPAYSGTRRRAECDRAGIGHAARKRAPRGSRRGAVVPLH
ncbi:MAG: arginine--tRNA ligase domain-containing protein [Coriobacteriia bacterium]